MVDTTDCVPALAQMCINNTSFAHSHWNISTPSFLFVICVGYKRFAQCSALLQTLNQWLSVSLGRGHPSQANCKICLKSAGLNAFFGWICVVLFCLKASHHWKNASLDKKRLGSTIPWIDPRLVTHINELSVKFIAHINHLHTCLAETMNLPETGKFIGWNIIIPLLSANKNSPVYLLKSREFSD